uniref:Uncharacterized protein n=1 Tax=Rhizophora mucronata TaxID=61149 RepID=A0A2P2Q966_RHIMU
MRIVFLKIFSYRAMLIHVFFLVMQLLSQNLKLKV